MLIYIVAIILLVIVIVLAVSNIKTRKNVDILTNDIDDFIRNETYTDFSIKDNHFSSKCRKRS